MKRLKTCKSLKETSDIFWVLSLFLMIFECCFSLRSTYFGWVNVFRSTFLCWPNVLDRGFCLRSTVVWICSSQIYFCFGWFFPLIFLSTFTRLKKRLPLLILLFFYHVLRSTFLLVRDVLDLGFSLKSISLLNGFFALRFSFPCILFDGFFLLRSTFILVDVLLWEPWATWRIQKM